MKPYCPHGSFFQGCGSRAVVGTIGRVPAGMAFAGAATTPTLPSQFTSRDARILPYGNNTLALTSERKYRVANGAPAGSTSEQHCLQRRFLRLWLLLAIITIVPFSRD
jgi:hypothetical protein